VQKIHAILARKPLLKFFGRVILCGLFCMLLLLQVALQAETTTGHNRKNNLTEASSLARIDCAKCEQNASLFENQAKSLGENTNANVRKRAENSLHAFPQVVFLGCATWRNPACGLLHDSGHVSARIITHAFPKRAGPSLS